MTTLSETMTDYPAGAKRRSDPGRWMTWPAVIYLLLMTQAPFVVTMYLSVHSWNLLYPMKGVRFVGLANYGSLIARRRLPDGGGQYRRLHRIDRGGDLDPRPCLAMLLDRMTAGRGFAYTLLLAPFLLMETVGADHLEEHDLPIRSTAC